MRARRSPCARDSVGRLRDACSSIPAAALAAAIRVDFPALLGPTKNALEPKRTVNLWNALKFHNSSCWIRVRPSDHRVPRRQPYGARGYCRNRARSGIRPPRLAAATAEAGGRCAADSCPARPSQCLQGGGVGTAGQDRTLGRRDLLRRGLVVDEGAACESRRRSRRRAVVSVQSPPGGGRLG